MQLRRRFRNTLRGKSRYSSYFPFWFYGLNNEAIERRQNHIRTSNVLVLILLLLEVPLVLEHGLWLSDHVVLFSVRAPLIEWQ